MTILLDNMALKLKLCLIVQDDPGIGISGEDSLPWETHSSPCLAPRCGQKL